MENRVHFSLSNNYVGCWDLHTQEPKTKSIMKIKLQVVVQT